MSWLQDCEDHIAGALETLAALVTDVVPALSFRPLSSSCPGTYRRRDPHFTFAHAVSPSVVPPPPCPPGYPSRPRCGEVPPLGNLPPSPWDLGSQSCLSIPSQRPLVADLLPGVANAGACRTQQIRPKRSVVKRRTAAILEEFRFQELLPSCGQALRPPLLPLSACSLRRVCQSVHIY